MDTPENALEENRRLRRTMRDLVALSTLPAVWTGLRPDGIARSLADVLLNTLSLDLIYVRLAGLPGEEEVEVVRGSRHPAPVEAVRASLALHLKAERTEPPATIPDPFGPGALHVAVTRFGLTDDNGVLVACSRREGFPSEQDRLLLGVGANQTAIVVQRRRVEWSLDEQRERLRTTLASIGDAVITTDARGRVTYLNAVAESLTGWTHEEAAGRPLEVVFDIINEQTRQPVENPVAKVLREGTVVGLANHTVLIGKDGTERPIDDTAAPIRGRDGAVVGCVLVFRDVTERRREENLLQESELRYRLVGQAANDAIWDWNLVTNRVTWSEGVGRVFGYTQEQVGPDSAWWVEHIHPDDRDRITHGIHAAIDGGRELWHDEYRFRRADGSHAAVFDRGRVVRDGGRPVRMVGSMLDLTERKRLEDELRQADRRKDEFLATLAHELRNPLAPIRNGLQVLKLSDRREAREQARGMMERQLEQMVRLVDDLMDVSRISRGKLELKRERVPLAAVLASAVETSRPLIEQMGHDLTVNLPDHIDRARRRPDPAGPGVPEPAEQRAKYMDRGGRIRLTAERQGSEVVVSVADTGIGIAADHLPRIFEMFSQVDRSLEKAQGGLGIGLTLVRRLVEMHGGSIEARSEGLGRGSEFVVRLPVVVEASVPPKVVPRDDHPPPRSSLRILIVDDNRDGADSLSEMLNIMGNDTRTAYDGEEAVAAAVDFRPDVILLDIGLPRLNGYDACRRIREQPGGTKMVLVAQTGWGADEDRHRTTAAGFDHHMVKPVDPFALMKLLAGVSDAARS